MKRRLWVIIVCVLLVGSMGAPASGRGVDPSASAPAVEPSAGASADDPEDWPQFRQGPAHTGYNPAETTISPANVAGLGLAWMGPHGDWITSSPAVADGVVYVGSYRTLSAFAVGCNIGGGTCAPLWIGATGAENSSSPAVADGVVYIGSWDGNLYAFAVGCRSDGGPCPPIWTANTGAWSASSPVVADGVVYIGSGDGKLYAFEAGCNSGGGSCTPLWTGKTGDPMSYAGITSSPAVADGVVYIGSSDGNLYAFAVGCRSDGGPCPPLWTGKTGDWILSSPAVADGVVYVGSDDGKLYAFGVGCRSDGGACTPLWTGTTGAWIETSPAIANDVVYIGSGDGDLYTFGVGCRSDGGRCAPLWTADVGASLSSPAVADGVVYIGSWRGNLYAFGAGCNTGGRPCAPLWTWLGGGTSIYSSPTVSNGAVYVGSGDGRLYAFDLVHGDVTPPVITSAPRVEGAVPSTLGHGSTLISWQGSDGAGSGIVRYDVQFQRDGGSWTTIASNAATQVTRSLKLGHSYRYRVRAYDRAGNRGAWVTSAATVPQLVQGSSSKVRYRIGKWHTQVTAKASGGSTRWSRSTEARATFSFMGRAVAWVTSTGPTRGRVEVYVDGVWRAGVDLQTNATHWQRVLFSASWARRGTHTIQLRSSLVDCSVQCRGTRADVDAFVVYR